MTLDQHHHHEQQHSSIEPVGDDGLSSFPIPIVDKFQPLQWMWAIRQTDFGNPLVALLAYEHLAHADTNGLCFPSVERLSLRLGVGRTQTQTLRRELVTRGFLELAKKGTGRGRASVYRLATPIKKTLSEPAASPGSKTLSATSPKTLSRTEHQEVHEEELPPQGVVVEDEGAHPVGGSLTERGEPSTTKDVATRRAVATLGVARPELIKPNFDQLGRLAHERAVESVKTAAGRALALCLVDASRCQADCDEPMQRERAWLERVA
jgi:hypothetical protein